MEFVYPTFLWSLLALAIPIIIHLFHFRRFKKVYFTNVRFLKEVKEETSARSRLRNLLVLLMRLLALTFLILAFAQPFLPQGVKVKKGNKAVSIYIDNSFSMNALSQEVPLLELAKRRALDIVNAYGVEDQFQIITNEFQGKSQRLLSKEDALSDIEQIAPHPAVRNLGQVLDRQTQVLRDAEEQNRVAYMISDFQRNITDWDLNQDSLIDINLVPLQSVEERNVSIDSAWFEAPVQMLNQTNPLLVKVTNRSAEVAENIRLSLDHEGQKKPVGVLSIPANSSRVDTVNITILRTGFHKAVLQITDYPINFDDRYFVSFGVAEQVEVLSINESTGNRFIDAVYGSLPNFKVDNQRKQELDYGRLNNYQLLILNELNTISSGLAFEVQQYVENGGNLLIFPSAEADLTSYQAFLKTLGTNTLGTLSPTLRTVGAVNTDEFIFNDVFENRQQNLKLPTTQQNFPISRLGSRGEEALLSYRDGSTFLGKYSLGKGQIYLCSAPLDPNSSDLVRNAEIFVPMLYKTAIAGEGGEPIAYTIGKDEVITSEHFPVETGETIYRLRGTQEEFIPEQRTAAGLVYLGVNEQVEQAGYYDLYLEPEEILDVFAFNFDRQESDLRHYSEAELESLLIPGMQLIKASLNADFGTIIGERSQGVVLWRWCLILALVFLLAEVLLLRFWSK